MRIQHTVLGSTLRLTRDDRLALSRELAALAYDNSLISGGKLEALRAELETSGDDRERGTIDRNSPECNYGAF
jgi:hypothetical protein